MNPLKRLPLLIAAAFIVFGAQAQAQIVEGLSGASEAIEIEAQDGIEWYRDENLYLARGQARAKSGMLEVFAEVIKAHYRKGEKGGEIYLIELEGAVRIVTPGEIAYGERGRYELDRDLMLLEGGDLRLESRHGDDKIFARDLLEFHQKEMRAVARGAARAVHGDRELRADVLTAIFEADGDGRLQIVRLEAKGSVHILSNGDYAKGDEAVYYVREDKARLSGNVRITHDGNQLNGAVAEIDLASGVSRLLAGEGAGEDRVKGLILPRSGGDGS